LSGKFLIAYLIQKFEMEVAEMEKNTLKIPNISCGHCVNAIKNELTEMEGINSIEGNTEDKTITIEWDTPATLEGIKNKLKEINYPSV
jgi:copper chaperone